MRIVIRKIQSVKTRLQTYFVKDDGIFPNSKLPIVYYPGVLDLPKIFPALAIKRLFKENNWFNSWKQGIFTYHHYHSITHEVLGVVKGEKNSAPSSRRVSAKACSVSPNNAFHRPWVASRLRLSTDAARVNHGRSLAPSAREFSKVPLAIRRSSLDNSTAPESESKRS